MAWVTKFEGLISRDWQFTEQVDASLLRIRNLSTAGYRFVSKGFLARSRVIDGKPEILYRQAFWSEQESIIVDLSSAPAWMNQHPIAFRRDRSYKINWAIGIDAWEGYEEMRTKRTYFVQQSDLQNGLFNAAHNLEDENCLYTVWDSSNHRIEPSDVVLVDQNSILFDFSTLEPIDGTYRIVIVK